MGRIADDACQLDGKFWVKKKAPDVRRTLSGGPGLIPDNPKGARGAAQIADWITLSKAAALGAGSFMIDSSLRPHASSARRFSSSYP